MIRLLACFLAVIATAAARSPFSVLPPDPQSAFVVRGLPQASKSIVAVAGMPFSWAWQIRTPPNPKTNAWDFRLFATSARPVSKGDLLLARFWIRTIEADAGVGLARLIVERSSSPWTKSANATAAATPGGGWKKFELPFQIAESYATGEFSIQFWLTYDPQTIQIGGFSVEDYGPGVDWRTLGLETYPYEGHAANAPWRAAAAARIAKYRQSPIVVVARNADGTARANTPVRVRMKRHEFRFGTAVAAAFINDPSQDTYRRIIKEKFNSVVVENALKWRGWDRDRQQGVDAVDWLISQGLTVRGHNILWPSWKYCPDWLKAQASEPEKLRRTVRDHVTDVVSTMRGKLIDWDVINEPYTNHDLMDILGDSEMAEWFRLARQADPQPTLYINDYDLITNNGWNLAKFDYYRRIIPWLDSLGAPIGGIGIQSHFNTGLTSPERALQVFDLFAGFGKTLLVTEFTQNTTDERLQADFLRDFLTVAFSHPAVKGFYIWGFWEGKIWIQPTAMYRRDWSMKPNAQVWDDLIYKQWWTDVSGVTDQNGIFRTRGFLGDYDVEIGEPSATQTVALSTGDDRSPHYAIVGKQTPGSFAAAGVVNAASFRGGPVAPGEIVTIFGSGFGAPNLTRAQYEDGKLPRYAGDTKVYFDGTPAPLIYSAKGQVSAIVPYSAASATRVEVEELGTKTAAVNLPVAAAAPGIFCYAGGKGQAVTINAGGSFNGADHPAPRRGIITFFLTGEGTVRPAIGDGVLPTGGLHPAPAQSFGVYIGGMKCKIEFVGLVYAGVTQVNATVPAGAPTGDHVALQVVVSGVASPPDVTVAVN